jgi:hypothetical protein
MGNNEFAFIDSLLKENRVDRKVLCSCRVYTHSEELVRKSYVVVWNNKRFCLIVKDQDELESMVRMRLPVDWYAVEDGKIIKLEKAAQRHVIRIYGRLRGGTIKNNIRVI